MTKDELIERLAAIEHERWAYWQRQAHRQGFRDASGSVILSAGTVAAQERLAATPYDDLPEDLKEGNRAIARGYWDLITQAVEEADDAEADRR